MPRDNTTMQKLGLRRELLSLQNKKTGPPEVMLMHLPMHSKQAVAVAHASPLAGAITNFPMSHWQAVAVARAKQRHLLHRLRRVAPGK